MVTTDFVAMVVFLVGLQCSINYYAFSYILKKIKEMPIVLVLVYLISRDKDYFPIEGILWFFVLLLFIAIFGGIFWW